MRFLTHWLSQGSKKIDQVKTMSNGQDPKQSDRNVIASSVITAEYAEVKNPISAAELSAPISELMPQLQKSPEVVSVSPTQPPVKTQAMIDAELVNSDAWLNDIEKGKAEWSNQLALLQDKIAALQKIGGTVFLMPLGSYFDLETSAFLEEIFRAQLNKKIEELFNPNEFKKFIEEKTRTRWNSYPRSVDYYLGEFHTQRWLYVQGVNRFIELMDQNFEIIKSKFDELSQSEREYNPGAGGTNLSFWRGFTRKFSKEHLIGITPADFFPEPAPRHLRDYRAEEMGVSGARFLWALMGAVQILSQPNGRSTSEIGIEFEKKLIEEISDSYPAARIEPTPTTGDQGADVIMLVEGIKIVIQAKKYTGVVGNAAVQEVFAAKEYYEADYAMVVTNSRYTQSACTLANKIGVELATAQDYLRRIQQLLV